MFVDTQEAWEQGFAAGLLGDNECPYFAGTDEALTWLSAWIEGERIRLVQIERHTHKKTRSQLQAGCDRARGAKGPFGNPGLLYPMISVHSLLH
jgi:ribosome modulation factor